MRIYALKLWHKYDVRLFFCDMGGKMFLKEIFMVLLVWLRAKNGYD